MPIKWYGNGDLEDPIYKHFSRIVNFVIHCMIFTAILSGTWLLKEIKYEIGFFNKFCNCLVSSFGLPFTFRNYKKT